MKKPIGKVKTPNRNALRERGVSNDLGRLKVLITSSTRRRGVFFSRRNHEKATGIKIEKKKKHKTASGVHINPQTKVERRTISHSWGRGDHGKTFESVGSKRGVRVPIEKRFRLRRVIHGGRSSSVWERKKADLKKPQGS